ncbi:MAG: hypothetical protein DRJ47_10700 [Thermoprotei archaeon]|nr:MAG: hypothetical protein DRJ47_10700 [Thermoprotei archaeon]
MLDYVSSMEREGYAGGYIESTLKAVKSWLLHNGIEVKRKVKIRGARDTPSLRDEKVPVDLETQRAIMAIKVTKL